MKLIPFNYGDSPCDCRKHDDMRFVHALCVFFLVVRLCLHIGTIDGNVLLTNILYYAAFWDADFIVGILLNHVNVNSQIRGYTAIHYAAENGSVKVLKKLLTKKEIDVNMQGSGGGTPLFMACQNGHEEIVRCLLNYSGGTDANQPINNGPTPLQIASYKGHATIVQMLLEYGDTDVNHVEGYAPTPLQIASDKGHTAIVELLFRYGGANVNQPMNNGPTPLKLACLEGHVDTVLVLHEHESVDVKPTHKMVVLQCTSYATSAWWWWYTILNNTLLQPSTSTQVLFVRELAYVFGYISMIRSASKNALICLVLFNTSSIWLKWF